MRLPRRDSFRRRRNYLLALATELGSLPLRGIARLATGAPQPPQEWRRGLIIAHSHIGDVLYRTPSLPVLADATPQCKWTFLTSPAGAEVLRGNPHVHSVLPLVTGEDSWKLDRGGLALLRDLGFDAALCTNTIRYAPDYALAAVSRIPSRAGPTFKGLSALATHPLAIHFPSPFPAYTRAMVAQLASRPADWSLRPILYPDAADSAAADRAFARLELGARPVVACAPCTRQPRGSWPARSFAAILHAVSADHHIVFVGGGADMDRLRDAAAAAEVPARILAGTLNVRSLSVFLGRCAALLSQDSGPRHVGNAAGIPVAYLRNVAVHAVETGSYLSTELDLAPVQHEPDSPPGEALIRTLDAEAAGARFRNFVVSSKADDSGDTPHARSRPGA